ncbi:MAG: hypothetical protein RMK30_00690 [Anaerolineae bacterium]|nr:hypothetical protein [Anaerolineae bacterium]MDW8101387.1 hypothetical protein [Anaerolineae bacterium]
MSQAVGKHAAKDEKLSSKDYYFALQSSWGLTKHMDGLKAIKESPELCHFDKNFLVLRLVAELGSPPGEFDKGENCVIIK